MRFFEKMFSGSSTASYGRFTSFMALACLLIWASLLVSRKGEIPPVPETWLLLVCIPYGITKIGDIATGRKANESPQVQ